MPSSAFRQHVQGYIFTTRGQGLGYYKDADISGQLGAPKSQLAAETEAADSLCQKSKQKVYHVLKPRLLSSIAAEELD